MEIVDEGEIPRIVGVDFLLARSALGQGHDQATCAYVVGCHLHPLLEVGEQRHYALAWRYCRASDIGHAILVL